MSIVKKHFGTEVYTATYEVEEEQESMRLDQFMQIYLSSWSRQNVKKKITDGSIIIEGRPGKQRPSTLVHYKEHITIVIKDDGHEDEFWDGEKLELDKSPEIVFEDDELIVISKPPYMSTHPTGKHLFNCATVVYENRDGKTIHSVHRLDRETSGILVLGKNPKISNIMGEHFINDRVRKCYFFIAIANDEYNGDMEFESNERLGSFEKRGLKRVLILHYPEASTEGKHARTLFKVVHREGKYVMGLAFPQTGRQHQIRVHAMVRGLPLLGDKLYLGNFKMFQRFKDLLASPEDHELMQISRHALHAISIKIPYKNGERIFKSHIPKDLEHWLVTHTSISMDDLHERLFAGIDDYFNRDSK